MPPEQAAGLVFEQGVLVPATQPLAYQDMTASSQAFPTIGARHSSSRPETGRAARNVSVLTERRHEPA